MWAQLGHWVAIRTNTTRGKDMKRRLVEDFTSASSIGISIAFQQDVKNKQAPDLVNSHSWSGLLD